MKIKTSEARCQSGADTELFYMGPDVHKNAQVSLVHLVDHTALIAHKQSAVSRRMWSQGCDAQIRCAVCQSWDMDQLFKPDMDIGFNNGPRELAGKGRGCVYPLENIKSFNAACGGFVMNVFQYGIQGCHVHPIVRGHGLLVARE